MLVNPTGSSARSSAFISPPNISPKCSDGFSPTLVPKWGKKGVSDAGFVEAIIWKWPWTAWRTLCLNEGFSDFCSPLLLSSFLQCLVSIKLVKVKLGLTSIYSHLPPPPFDRSTVPSRCWDASPEPCLKLQMYLHSLSTTWQHNLELVFTVRLVHLPAMLHQVCQSEIWFCNPLLNALNESLLFNTGPISHTV